MLYFIYFYYIALSWNANVSSAYRIAFAKNANEAESSDISQQKMQSILCQNSSISKMELAESDTVRIYGGRDLTSINQQINITIVKSYVDE